MAIRVGFKSNQPDLFRTDRRSQDFHSVSGHSIKKGVQTLSTIGLLVGNLSCL